MDIVAQKLIIEYENIEAAYNEAETMVNSVEIMSDNKLYNFYLKQKKKYQDIALKYKSYKELLQEESLYRDMLKSSESDSLSVKAELDTVAERLSLVYEDLKSSYFNMQSMKNEMVQVELTYKSGDVDSLADYKAVIENFATVESLNIMQEKQDSQHLVYDISGEGAYYNLKHFSGLVKIIKNSKESFLISAVIEKQNNDISFSENDVIVETLKSGGAGGQHINKTESAVRLVHVPTGISVKCQDERSQTKNKERAMETLKQKILQKIKENNENYIKNQRKNFKNAIFSDTPIVVFDFDKHLFIDNRLKKSFDINVVLSGNLQTISNELKVKNG